MIKAKMTVTGITPTKVMIRAYEVDSADGKELLHCFGDCGISAPHTDDEFMVRESVRFALSERPQCLRKL